MRTGIALSFVALLNLAVLVPALQADVIPNKVESPQDLSAKGKVVERLKELGMTHAEARSQVDKLPDDVVAHYANNPQALQNVSGLWLEEVVVGLGLFAVLGVIVWGIYTDINDSSN